MDMTKIIQKHISKIDIQTRCRAKPAIVLSTKFNAARKRYKILGAASYAVTFTCNFVFWYRLRAASKLHVNGIRISHLHSRRHIFPNFLSRSHTFPPFAFQREGGGGGCANSVDEADRIRFLPIRRRILQFCPIGVAKDSILRCASHGQACLAAVSPDNI